MFPRKWRLQCFPKMEAPFLEMRWSSMKMNKLLASTCLRLWLFTGSSVLSAACTTIWHDELQHFLYAEENSFAYHMTTFVQKMKAPFLMQKSRALTIWKTNGMISYQKTFASKVSRYATIEMFEVSIYIHEAVHYHSLGASLATTEVIFLVLIRQWWKGLQKPNVPGNHFWVHPLHPA